MSESKPVPGPWVDDVHGHIMAHNGTTNVASTWTTPDENYPEGRPYRANARLLAAAPDLLEALIESVMPYAAILMDQESQRWIAPEIWAAMHKAHDKAVVVLARVNTKSP